MSRGLRSRLRPTVPALLVVAGLVLSGCGGSSPAEVSSSSADGGHGDHAGAPPATVQGPDERFKGFDLAEPYRRPSFTLTDTAGASFDFKEQTAGRPTLLFFGYTNCPDICPTTMADVTVALRTVDPSIADQVQVVFVTTDPGADTPEVLGNYLGQFDADLPVRYIGLTGDQEAIEQAQLSAGVPLAEDDGRAHSALLLLYGEDDAAHVAFDSGNTSSDIADDLAVVVA